MNGRRRARRRPRDRTVRPATLVGAMLAPVILAATLVAAHVTGYGTPPPDAAPPPVASPSRSAAVRLTPQAFAKPGSRRTLMRPTLLPPPPGPDRRYGGYMPGTLRLRATPTASLGGQDADPGDAAERKAGTWRCPGEWRDTWLWEMCQERARRAT